MHIHGDLCGTCQESRNYDYELNEEFCNVFNCGVVQFWEKCFGSSVSTHLFSSLTFEDSFLDIFRSSVDRGSKLRGFLSLILTME